MEDLLLLCDLFFLPAEHGPRGVRLLTLFASLLAKSCVTEEEAQSFAEVCDSVEQLKTKVTGISNRDLLYALYTYLWGVNEEQDLMARVVKHRATGRPLGEFRSQFHQPYTYRGGVVRGLQELLPMASDGSFSVRAEKQRKSPCFTVRPYRDSDEEAVYRVCLETGDEGSDGTHLFDDGSVLGHRWAGPYLTGEDIAFVLEDDEGVCGYTLAALDTEEFNERFVTVWAPKLRGMYPTPPELEQKDHWSEDEKVIHGFYEPELMTEKEIISEYPAHLHIDLIARGQGKGYASSLFLLSFPEALSLYRHEFLFISLCTTISLFLLSPLPPLSREP